MEKYFSHVGKRRDRDGLRRRSIMEKYFSYVGKRIDRDGLRRRPIIEKYFSYVGKRRDRDGLRRRPIMEKYFSYVGRRFVCVWVFLLLLFPSTRHDFPHPRQRSSSARVDKQPAEDNLTPGRSAMRYNYWLLPPASSSDPGGAGTATAPCRRLELRHLGLRAKRFWVPPAH
ncbi:hypothetical protein RRG08_038251 [Elysia crispata]|uniref:Uncharacterized protein n=1 Tax=Elysia crispata TaxID=231223 RepID=A0AAE1AMQ7_9GAST|nr:hypothetical protein RRG08_038251 [Elysia crispata]